jgi:transcriptional regulator GlxA family with amidase domain
MIMSRTSRERTRPFLALIDRFQVIAYESSGLALLLNLQQALGSNPAISHLEVAVIRGLVGRLAARAIYDAGLDGTALRLILEADTVGDLHASVAVLVAANPRQPLDPRIERVLDHLRRHHPDREITRLEALASIANVTPTHLSRLMRKTTGEGVVSHARKLRVAHAVELLNQGADTVAGVARKVGYRHPADFSRDFQRIMGTTPGRFSRSSPDRPH